ncbi:MAG: hypothetical protein JNG90_18420 [Planctomycetaceae bacterium]|nr:hypothetical protein [Planctomycetaceae bacterium]
MGQSVLEHVSEIAGVAGVHPLALGYCTGSRAGEIIELARPKCYLSAGGKDAGGDGPRRLSAVQCLILRGAEQTIVRKWSQGVRLNGRDFSDARLAVGDRLQLGSVELEVLADASPTTVAEWRQRLTESDPRRCLDRTTALESRTADLARRAGALERNELDLHRKTEQVLRLAEELHKRQVLLDTLAAEICCRESDAQRREAANDQLRRELDAQAATIAASVNEIKGQRVSLREEQSAAAERLQAERREWQAQQAAAAAVWAEREAALAARETAWAEEEASRTAGVTVASEVQATADSANPVREELEAARRDIERDREALEKTQSDVAEAQAELGRQRQTLTTERTELEAAVQRLASERESFAESQSQSTAREAELTKREVELERQLAGQSAAHAQLAEQQQQLEELTRQAAAIREDLSRRETILTEHQAQVAGRQAELEVQAQQLTSQVAVWQAERDELAQARSDFEAELLSQRAAADQARTQFDADRRQCEEQLERLARRETELGEALASLRQRAAELDAREHSLGEREQRLEESTAGGTATLVTAAGLEAAVDAGPQPNEDACPGNDEAIFQRLAALSILREELPSENDDQVAPADDVSAEDEPECGAGDTHEVAAAEPSAAIPAGTTSVDDLDEGSEEQIIQRYMAQLLSRTRGEAGSAPSAGIKKAEKIAAPTQLAVPAPSEPAPAGDASRAGDRGLVGTPEGQSTATGPRRQPLPSASDISAMRELANQSVKAALETHSRNQLTNDLYVKVVVFLSALVAGTVLVSWAPQIGWFGLLAGGACYLGAIVWGIEATLKVRRLVQMAVASEESTADQARGAVQPGSEE